MIALKRALRSILSISPCCLVSNVRSLTFALPSFGFLSAMISIVFSDVFWLRCPLPSFGRVLVKICVACFGLILVKICAAWLWFQNRIQSLAGSFCDFGNPTSHPKSGWFLKSQAALKIWRAHYVILQIQNRIQIWRDHLLIFEIQIRTQNLAGLIM